MKEKENLKGEENNEKEVYGKNYGIGTGG